MRNSARSGLVFKAVMAFALALPLIGMASAGAAARADGPAAQAQPQCGTVPTQRSRVTKDSSLTGIAVTARCNAWAMGWNFTGPLTQTLIEHWNGAKWTQVPSPSPYRPHGDNLLYGVAATSFRNAWAVGVGAQRPGVSAIRTLIEHWNGKSWTHVPSPNPDTANALLTGIAAASASNSWAVGYSFTPGVTSQSRVTTVIERWNGESWSLVPSPSPAARARGDNRLLAVAALSSGNAWAVGYSRQAGSKSHALIEHWNGKSWAQVPGAGPGQKDVVLLGVAAISASNAWAVGTSAAGNEEFGVGTGNRTLILHWNGKSWRQVSSPNPAGALDSNELTAVAALSGANAWAIGNHAALHVETEPVAEHWSNGWHLMPIPILR